MSMMCQVLSNTSYVLRTIAVEKLEELNVCPQSGWLHLAQRSAKERVCQELPTEQEEETVTGGAAGTAHTG